MRYKDRADAGKRLAPDVADALGDMSAEAPVVLGIPRGGVIVGAEVARAISAELDVVLARKIGAPGNPELALGAVGEEGEPVLSHDLIAQLGVTESFLERAIAQARSELARSHARLRRDRTATDIAGRVAVVVDDGIATGATLRATLRTVRERSPRTLVCAVPVGPVQSVATVGAEVDDMVCPLQPRWFRAVGEWYDAFAQTTDEEVVAALEEFRRG